MRRLSLQALVAIFIGAAAVFPHGASAEEVTLRYGVIPETDQLFHRLLADPRQAQTTARYYRNNGEDIGDTALGATWGLARWQHGEWFYQSNLEGMGYSRFRLSGSVNEFQTIDFFLNLPLELRRGLFSGRVMIFHESSHLGDDYIRRTGRLGERFSIEGLRAMVSYDFPYRLRAYVGGMLLLHSVPKGQRGDFQAGAEFRSRDLQWVENHECWIYIAQDFKSRGRNQWNVSSNTELGLRIGAPKVIRAIRLHVGRFDGHSEFGQFHRSREAYWNLGVSFDF